MIIACGGIKGGVGKTTIALNMAILRAKSGREVVLVDSDDQGTATYFTLVRNDVFGEKGAGYTAVQFRGSAVRTETMRLAKKFDDVIIDVGGRDTAGQRAALTVADTFLVPFIPASFDIWALEKVGVLVNEAISFNEKLKVFCFLNRADPRGKDNAEAIQIASELPEMDYLDAPIGNRKAFRNAASQGLAVTESKPTDAKAKSEMLKLFRFLFEIEKISKGNHKCA